MSLAVKLKLHSTIVISLLWCLGWTRGQMTTNTRNSSEKEQVYSGIFRPQYFFTFQVSRTGKKTKGLMSIWDPVFYHHKTLVHHTRKRHFKNSTIYLRLFKQLWQAWSSLSEGIMLTITSTYNRQENDKTNIKIICN